jgi:hypothetical protein
MVTKNNLPEDKISDSPYGEELANLVADRLVNCPLMLHHKEYSGMGLAKLSGGSYVYGPVNDGSVTTPEEEFKSREEFAKWLASQSDLSLSRSKDNLVYQDGEGITLKRLLHYAKYSEKSTRGDF